MKRAAILAALMCCASYTAAVQPADTTYVFDLQPQPLKYALRSVTRAAGMELLADSHLLTGKNAPALHGHFTASEALDALLQGTGLTVQISGQAVYVRGRDAAPGSSPSLPAATDHAQEIYVTGSHISGATPASPVTRLTRRQLEGEGFNNLGDALRALPQNFSGGQNPGVAGGGIQGANNQNVTSSSTLNLRGLGPDATLTLINGHRMPYDAVYQGIDISAIPLAAIDRIEVVADGASALYGSDAVGGVANIILRSDYSGARASVRVGGATDGGDFQQQYDGIAGAVWQSGGVIAAFDYNRSTALLARDRAYTQSLDASSTLIPSIRQTSALLAGHQSLADGLRFDVDANFNRRVSRVQSPSTTTADYRFSGALSEPEVTSYSVSPKLSLELSASWHATLTGTYGASTTNVASPVWFGGALIQTALVHYRDQLGAVEAAAEGRLLTLPAGDIRLATGIGYRDNLLDTYIRTLRGNASTVLADFSASRDSEYGYGELNIPLFAPGGNHPGLYRLSLNAAGRYERYPGLGHVATPKLGLVYAPVPDFDLKGSWGTSFKAPTLYQQFNYKAVSLRPISAYGATGYPANATVLQTSGGNADGLKPERARTWTITLAVHPRLLPAALLEVSYFRISYRDRIISPLQSSLGALTNPIYANIVTLAPTPDQIAAALANAPAGLSNQTGAPFDPASVVAILDNRQRNSARQIAHGIDMSARYSLSTERLGKFVLNGQASYLDSRQVLISGQPSVDLAGIIFNPPHWRARAGVDWDAEPWTASLYFNRVSGEIDNRLPTSVPVGAFNTVDLAAGYTLQTNGPLKGLSLSLSVTNLLKTRPPLIRQAFGIDPSYDSANTSAVGRFLGVTIAKAW